VPAPAPLGANLTQLMLLGVSVAADTDPRTPQPGFVLERGRYTKFDTPGARGGTSPNSINNRDVIVGYYAEGAGDPFGRGPGPPRPSPSGSTTAARSAAPGRWWANTGTPPARATAARDLNNRGQVAGFTFTGLEEFAQGARGFLLADGVKGQFTPIDVPGAPRNAVLGLNDRGQLVGYYENTAATASPQPAGTPPMSRTF
jgi:hypothetical protein